MRKALLVLAATASLFLAPLASEAQTGQPSTPETGQSAVATPSPMEPLFLATFQTSGSTSSWLEADATSSSAQRDHAPYEFPFASCSLCRRECGESGGRPTRFGCECC